MRTSIRPDPTAASIALALAAADIGVWEWSNGEGMVQVNTRWSEMIGYAPGELDLSGFKWYELIHLADLAIVHEETLTQANASAQGQFRVEFRMRHKAGHWVWIESRGQVVERDADGTAVRLAGAHLDITQRKAAEETIKKLAFFDALTQLPNRQLMMERLQDVIATSRRDHHHGALLFIDLDNFKQLNDSKGHQTGDLLLQRVAQRLKIGVREVDTVARLGGDEFVVILKSLDPNLQKAVVQARWVGQKLLVALNEPYELNGYEHHGTPSIGATLFSGTDTDRDELLKRADLAMYQAKADGRNLLRFFDPAMQAAVAERNRLEAELRLALIRDEISVVYQPVVDTHRQVIGYEALARWQHATRGAVPPQEFIALAEDSGLILQLGAHVLRVACRQLAA